MLLGPNEITIFAPEGPVALLGPNSKCIKAAWYDGGLPMISMHTARNRAVHDKRRKVWDRGFGAKGAYLLLIIVPLVLFANGENSSP